MTNVDTQVKPHTRDNLVSSGEFCLTAKDFAEIAAVMHREAGIALPENKVNLVYSRLAKRLRLLGLNNFHEYCNVIRDHSSPPGRNERDAMIAALTTNVTKFFREPHHFEHLKLHILPKLIHQAKLGQPIRIWSSACSSGQEPYSIGLTILSLLPEAANYNIKILASDIDPNMIALGEAGNYDKSALNAVPPTMVQRWFSPVASGSGEMRANAELRTLVRFRKLNLMGNWPMRGLFHAIFCRNVVIYFDNETQSRVWSRMVPLLAPEAALYIGHSERISGPAEALLRSDGVTIYRHAHGTRVAP
ncbi:MAG: protein-glutamate O-methyltransferase CheR [Acidocella sp.]|nr:protein-glutamate O-methyltransferase CheR [Acidocella sp.]